MSQNTEADELFHRGLKSLKFNYTKQDLNEAIEYLRSASSLDPENKMIWFNLGILYRKQGKTRYDDAISCFERTIYRDPAFKPAWSALAQIYSKIKQGSKQYGFILDELMSIYEFYSEFATQNNVCDLASPLILAFVILLNDNGYYDNAMRFCTDQLDKTPTNYSFATQKAIALEQQGLFSESIKYYELALQHGIDINQNLICKALCCYAIGEYHNAIQMYEQALKLNVESDVAYIGMGGCYSRLSMYDEALRCYVAAEDIENTPDNAKEQLITLGDDLFENDKFDEALQAYLQALSGDSDDDLVYFNLGLCSLLMDRKDEAIVYFKDAKNFNKNGQFTCEFLSNLIQSLDHV